MIDLRFADKVHFRLSEDKGCTVISVRVPGEIDLVSDNLTLNIKIEISSVTSARSDIVQCILKFHI